MSSPKRPLLSLLAAAALAACSGAATNDLFSPGGTAPASTGEGEPAANGDESGTGGETGDADVAARDGETRRDAGTTTSDGGTGGGSDAGTKPDVAAIDAGPARTLNCSSSGSGTTCDVGAEVCCKTGTSYSCETGNCASTTALEIPCDDSDDCSALGKSASVCCLSTTSTGKPSEVVCRAPVDCDMNDGRHGMCDPNAADPCPSGGNCKLSTVTLPGFYLCF